MAIFLSRAARGQGIAKPPAQQDYRVILRYLADLHRTLFITFDRLVATLNAVIDHLNTPTRPNNLASFTVAGVPTASLWTGALIYVSNETGGAVPAFSDGTNWRRVTDRAIIA